MAEISQELKQKLIDIACKQIDTCNTFKYARLNEVRRAEQMYANNVRKQLKNRFNVPLPILGGFVDTLKSKIDDAPVVSYLPTAEEDYKSAKKVQAVFDKESSDDKGRWAYIDRMVKTLCIFQGRGIYNIYADGMDGFSSYLEFTDLYDFIFEPQGGGDLEKHLFVGQSNIFKTKAELLKGAEKGYYSKEGVRRLILSGAEESRETKEVTDKPEDRFGRYKSMGLDPISNNYVGVPIYNLTQLITTYNGKRYYLLLDKARRVPVRCEDYKEICSSQLYPYVSWATHEDPYNFLSKAAVDDIVPVSESMTTVFNQALDNLQKRNWGMRAYDSTIFPNPEELRWRPDGLVAVRANGQGVDRGVYTFDTPDNTNITVNMFEFLDNFLGQKTGITAGAQGSADKDAKVGVYYGDMQQVADRLGLYNKAYKEAWSQLGKRFIGGLKDYLTEKYAIKIIGNEGVEWDELKKGEIKEYDVTVSGGTSELELNQLRKNKQEQVIASIFSNPILMQKVNINWFMEKLLASADFDDEEIKTALDNQNRGNMELMSEAAQSIQEILKGKIPKINRGATTAFVAKIVNFAIDKLDNDKDNEKYMLMMDYAMAHLPIAQKNMQAKLTMGLVTPQEPQEQPPQMGGGAPQPAMAGAPQSEGQTQQVSQGLTGAVAP